MYTKCIKQLQKRCMIHEKQTIQKKNNMRENAGIQFEQEQQQPNDHNHKTDFITVFNDENICEFVYTQKDFPALLSNILGSLSVDCCVKRALFTAIDMERFAKGRNRRKKTQCCAFYFTRNELNVCAIFTTSSICNTLLILKY